MKSRIRRFSDLFWIPRKFTYALVITTAFISSAAGQTNTFPSSGNVGIGTTEPAAKLEIKDSSSLQVTPNQAGSGEFATSVLVNSAGVGLTLLPDGNGAAGPKLFLGYRDTSAGMWRSALEIANRSGFGNLLLMKSGGNVGIGTSTPTFRLDVAGDINTLNPYKIQGATVLSTLGLSNVFVGVGAGAANIPSQPLPGDGTAPGSLNSFFGASAGRANTTGVEGSFFGALAGTSSTGNFNSFFGARTGGGNESGNRNTLIGAHANVGAGNLTNATAIGFNAQVSASNSLVLGSNANVGIGTTRPAFRLDVAGDVNTSTQYKINGLAVLSTAGPGNLFVGQGVAETNTTGQNNAFFGRAAANANTTGSNNAVFGRSAGNANRDGNNNSFFGNSAGRDNRDGSSNAFFGQLAGRSNTSGNGNTFVGALAGRTNVGSGPNTIIGFNADVGSVGLQFATAIGANAVVSTSNTVVLGRPNGEDTVRIPGLGIGAGGSTPLCRNGSNQISSCGFSLLRYKRDVKPLVGGLNLVRQLRPVSFRWKTDGTPEVGLAAEEVAKIAPLLVTRDSTGEIEGVRYDRLGVVLIKAVQEQQAQIKEQELQLQTKDARITELETRLAALERVMLSNPNITTRRARAQKTSSQTKAARRAQAHR